MAGNIPHHIGLILDGNRRWAKEKGLPAMEGHRKGLERVKESINLCKERGIDAVTFFCFSTENWKRPKTEVNYLMKLLQQAFVNDSIKKFNEQGIRIKVIGERERLPEYLKKDIAKAEESTKNNKEMTVNLAISYGGRAELVSAMKNIIAKGIPPEKITEESVSQNLWTTDLDLIIRTGKEQRISNFLIWQAAYAELHFSPKHWPDFNKNDLDKAIEDYGQRARRFGK